MPPSKKTTARKPTTRKPAGTKTTGKGKTELTKEYGPLPLWGWLAVGVAAWYFYSHVLASGTNENPNAGSPGGGGRVGRGGHRGGGGGGGGGHHAKTHGQKNHGRVKTTTPATAPSMTTARIRTSTREHRGGRTDSRRHRSGR